MLQERFLSNAWLHRATEDLTELAAFARTGAGTPLPPTAELRERCKGALADYEIPKAFLSWNDAWPTRPRARWTSRR